MGNVRVEDVSEPALVSVNALSMLSVKYCCSGSRWERIRFWMEKRVAEICLGEQAMMLPESCSFVSES